MDEARPPLDAPRPPSLFTPAAHPGESRDVFAPDHRPPASAAGTHDLFSVAPPDEYHADGVPLVAPGQTPRRWMTTLLAEIDLRDEVPRVVRPRRRERRRWIRWRIHLRHRRPATPPVRDPGRAGVRRLTT